MNENCYQLEGVEVYREVLGSPPRSNCKYKMVIQGLCSVMNVYALLNSNDYQLP